MKSDSSSLQIITRTFLPNNHSNFSIHWKKVPGPTRTRIAFLVLKKYAFDRVHENEIHQVGEWEQMSNNFRVAVEIAGEKRYILFRKHLELNDKKTIDILDAVISYIGGMGIPAPRIIPTKYEEKSFFFEGNYYTAYEFIRGSHFRGTKRELIALAHALARLHRALAGIPYEAAVRRRKKLLPPWTKKQWDLIFKEASRNRTVIDKAILNSRALIISAMAEAQKVRQAKLKKQVVHGDLHPQNTIFENGEIKAFLDFENAIWAERIRDVANAMHRFVRQYIIYKGGYWKKLLAEGVFLFLETYKKTLPLEREEEKLISAVIMDELLRKLSKDISKHYFSGESGFLEKGELEKKLMLLREAHYFFV